MRFQKKYSNQKEQLAFEAGVKAGFKDAQIIEEQVQLLKGQTDTKRLNWMIKNEARVELLDGEWACVNWDKGFPMMPSPREAIDAAMKEKYE